MALESHSTENSLNGSDTVVFAPPVITPPKHVSRGPLSWPSCSEAQSGTPGGSRFDETSEAADSQRSSVQLPTPQSPATLSSYLLADSGTARPYTHNAPFGHQSSMLPTEFRAYTTPSPPPPPFRSQQTLTPESSPLPMQYRGGASNSQQQQPARTNIQDPAAIVPPEPMNLGSRTVERTGSHGMPSRPATPEGQQCLPSSGNSLHADASHTDLPCTPLRKSPVLLPRGNESSQDPSVPRAGNINIEGGGEISQTRAQLIENHLALTQEAEARRPDYLKRTKRTAQELESTSATDGTPQGPALQPAANIGITESPIKGRRLTLFQETSDESFEESLMAGGYGRYRSDTLRWTQTENEVPNVVDAAAEPSVSVTSEREKKKKSRLAAFLDTPLASSSKAQLVPVEVEGRGRVLVNVDAAEPPTSPKPSPSKGRRSRRKKKVGVDTRGDKDGDFASSEAKVDGPNWPDAQFPWDSQLARCGMQAPEEEERLRHIENFLDRDSDEDEVEEGLSTPIRSSAEEIRAGRGKMNSLLHHSKEKRPGNLDCASTSIIPNDPADARTALLSKKSVRELSQRLLRRRNTDGDGERVCICNEPDNERDLVQCDGCQIWYHLDCIGIQSMSELGREEDPWFCAHCAEAKTPPPVVLSLSEPTLVPTDDKVNVDAGYDPPFFQTGLHPSPATPWTNSTRPPRTPPRSHSGPYFSSGSSWDEPGSRRGPHTPQFPNSQDVRVYTTPGRVGGSTLEESPFDPTSTPSRGIKFGAPFATPKNGLWRHQDMFHTPTRHAGISFGRQFAQYTSRGGEDDTSMVGLPSSSNSLTQDFTPVIRNLNDGGRVLESPLVAKRSRHSVDARLSTSQDTKQGVRRS